MANNYFFSSGRCEWVDFVDRGISSNEFGEKVGGNTSIGSGLCMVMELGTRTKRSGDGYFEVEEIEIHAERGIAVVPNKVDAMYLGSAYRISSKISGNDFTDSVLYTGVRKLG